VTLRVSLAPARRKVPTSELANASVQPLLDPNGARVVLGHSPSSVPAQPIVPAAQTMFGPRGAVLASKAGPLIVCDTGHHRLLLWREAPAADGTPADLVIGQPDFASEGRNGRGDPGPATLSVPTGVAVADGVLAVADAWNHRVLIWHGIPSRSNQPADVVLGQADFASTHTNRGRDTPGPDTFNWCYGVAIHQGRLWVADTGNRRVLMWAGIPDRNGTPADLVLGQPGFDTRSDGVGYGADAVAVRWPHAIAAPDATGPLFVADAGNNRAMVWRTVPTGNGTPCDAVLGQPDFSARDHNAGEYFPTPRTMNMPYGACVFGDRVAVADTANSRLLGFDLARLATGAPATHLCGQLTFEDKGDNRWCPLARDSLCWPYAVAACAATLVIADSGNNRVLLWDAA
jgi:hypothetical protein